MSALLTKSNALGLVQVIQLLEEKRSLGDESTFAEERQIGLETMLGREGVDVRKELLFGQTDERIADPARVSD